MSTCNDVAVGPVTIVIKECITLSSAMRKYTKYTAQSGVAALLGGGSEIFSNQDDSLASTFNNLSVNKHNDPLLSGFIQLRLMLNNLKSLDDVDSLTVLQPFLLVISTSSTSGYLTSLALDSLQKFFSYNIINSSSPNYTAAFRQTVISLTHCRFEGSEQLSDDSVLLKVLVLLETIINSKSGDVISDSVMYEVLQTVMSLACNKRRTEVLRRAAEMTMMSITVRIFNKLKYIQPGDTQKYINDEDYSKNELKGDKMGTSGEIYEQGQVSDEENSSIEKVTLKEDEKKPLVEENYGLPVIKDYLGILVSLIIPENQHKHNNSTKVFGLHLLNTAIELAGDKFPQHPRLFTLVSDPIFKNVLYTIQSTDKLSLLQAALQLFTTMTIILGDHLEMQVELTIKTIFDSLLDSNVTTETKVRSSSVKEMLIEQIAILWTRSPSFFTHIFVNYDCNLDRSDLSIEFLKSLTRLALPESALTTADSVPPICLEGLVSVVDDMFEHLQGINLKTFREMKEESDILKQRERKTEFIACTEAFNTKAKKGIAMLLEKGFIASDSEENIAKFLFDKNGRMNKKTIGEYIANPKNISLLKKFIDLFDFKNLRIDEAIRILLTKFRLPGESQQIERIVETFSTKYVESQEYDPSKSGQDIEGDYSTVQPDADSVFILSFSVIMLNTDLYNPQVKKHMTFDDYTYNLKGCNNQKDFPMWYLDKVYCSIRDKEIVMPEEHHGNDRWFDDAWNNLISSSTVITETHKDTHNIIEEMDALHLAQFNKAIFKHVGTSIFTTLFRIFEVASDDHISTRMLTSIDKCAFIASFFGFHEMFNEILAQIAKLTTLTGERDINLVEFETEDIPLVEIRVEDTKETIAISKTAVTLGRDFKGQLCTVVLFRVLQNKKDSEIINKDVWLKIFGILLNLFENLMISPDIFPDLQKKLKLGPLPKPASDFSINKSKVSKGLLSTFASYLKGDEEPTEEEINASLSALECVKSSNVPSSIFGNENNVNGELVSYLLDCLKTDRNEENSRFFEAELLFIMELAVSLFLFCKGEKAVGTLVLEKLVALSQIEKASKSFVRRILAYKILVISVLDKQEEILLELINHELLAKNEVYDELFFSSEQGAELLERLLSLTDIEDYSTVMLQNEGFWKVLRLFSSVKQHTLTVYQYLDTSVLKKSNTITKQNFMWLLGLLDEISSLGAIGGQWEQEYDLLIKTGHKINKENPYQEIVELSLKSINSTAHLMDVMRQESLAKGEIFALVQALAHQCLNPCYQLRSYALSSLETTIIKRIPASSEAVSVDELIEQGLFPLINNISSEAQSSSSLPTLEILSVLSKVYLHYLKLGETDNDTYLTVLNVFNRFVENPDVEKELQNLITEKRAIEKTPELENKQEEPMNEVDKESNNNPEKKAEQDNDQAADVDTKEASVSEE